MLILEHASQLDASKPSNNCLQDIHQFYNFNDMECNFISLFLDPLRGLGLEIAPHLSDRAPSPSCCVWLCCWILHYSPHLLAPCQLPCFGQNQLNVWYLLHLPLAKNIFDKSFSFLPENSINWMLFSSVVILLYSTINLMFCNHAYLTLRLGVYMCGKL